MGAITHLPSFRHLLASSLILSVILILITGLGWAQESKIQGIVTDETGGVIPGVEVTVSHIETGRERKVGQSWVSQRFRRSNKTAS